MALDRAPSNADCRRTTETAVSGIIHDRFTHGGSSISQERSPEALKFVGQTRAAIPTYFAFGSPRSNIRHDLYNLEKWG
jgi:hypothetical protein